MHDEIDGNFEFLFRTKENWDDTGETAYRFPVLRVTAKFVYVSPGWCDCWMIGSSCFRDDFEWRSCRSIATRDDTTHRVPKRQLLEQGHWENATGRVYYERSLPEHWQEIVAGERHALPGRVLPDCLQYFGLDQWPTQNQLDDCYRTKAVELHPDRGGSSTQFQQLRSEYELATQLLRGCYE